MKNRNLCVFLGFSTFFSFSAGAMNLFTNPSFEAGAAAVTFSPSSEFGGATTFALTSISSEIPGWTWEQNGAGGAVWLEDTADAFGSDGDYLLYLDTNEAIEWQDVSGELSGSVAYAFGYHFATWERGQDAAPGDPSSGEGTILLEYNYRDAGDDLQFGSFTTNLRPPENDDSAPGDLAWLSGSETLVIPADYGSAFKFQITTSGTGMLIDDLSFSAVPEARTAGLLGLAVLMLCLRRSRRG